MKALTQILRDHGTCAAVGARDARAHTRLDVSQTLARLLVDVRGETLGVLESVVMRTCTRILPN